MSAPELVRMRRGGGHVVHLVPEGSEQALCGEAPQSRRGAWRIASPYDSITCEKCQSLAQQDGEPC